MTATPCSRNRYMLHNKEKLQSLNYYFLPSARVESQKPNTYLIRRGRRLPDWTAIDDRIYLHIICFRFVSDYCCYHLFFVAASDCVIDNVRVHNGRWCCRNHYWVSTALSCSLLVIFSFAEIEVQFFAPGAFFFFAVSRPFSTLRLARKLVTHGTVML